MLLSTPKLSVVMSTYDDACRLASSIDSVLEQSEHEFEFIIVNDGSTDLQVEAIIEDYANRDSRIRVISKGNEGLTRALMDGCAAAKGKYIARIDVGDRYLPGRLSTQYQFMEAHSDLAFSSCWSRYVDADGDTVFEICRSDSPEEARTGMRRDLSSAMKGVTHHGSVLFRRDVYESVGGYRAQFHFAQDMDLWVRMTDQYRMAFIPEILYEAHFSPSGISGLCHRQQIKLGKIIIRMRQRRDLGLPEDGLLNQAASIHPRNMSKLMNNLNAARGEYFAGCQYIQCHPQKAIHHFLRALKANPLHLKATFRLFQAVKVRHRLLIP